MDEPQRIDFMSEKMTRKFHLKGKTKNEIFLHLDEIEKKYNDRKNSSLHSSSNLVEMKANELKMSFISKNDILNNFSYSTFSKLVRPKHPEHLFARLYQRLWAVQEKDYEIPNEYQEDVCNSIPETIFKKLINDDIYGTKEKKLLRQLEIDIHNAKMENTLLIQAFNKKEKRLRIVTDSFVIIVPAQMDFQYDAQEFPVVTFHCHASKRMSKCPERISQTHRNTNERGKKKFDLMTTASTTKSNMIVLLKIFVLVNLIFFMLLFLIKSNISAWTSLFN
jgi:hypothetical protein